MPESCREDVGAQLHAFRLDPNCGQECPDLGMSVQTPRLFIVEVVRQPDGVKAELLDANPVLGHDAVARKRRGDWITVAAAR
jgi:hypothetical protein